MKTYIVNVQYPNRERWRAINILADSWEKAKDSAERRLQGVGAVMEIINNDTGDIEFERGNSQ